MATRRRSEIARKGERTVILLLLQGRVSLLLLLLQGRRVVLLLSLLQGRRVVLLLLLLQGGVALPPPPLCWQMDCRVMH